MNAMNHIDQIFEDLKAELVSLVGDLSGVHNAVDNAKVALAPHIIQYGTEQEKKDDLGTTNENEGANPDAP
ncbi:MAG: hypothetical protein KGI54_07225 [Pseudomonadota bacterium]|nr:hypothetical protein [Pseudomonadota bacterium]